MQDAGQGKGATPATSAHLALRELDLDALLGLLPALSDDIARGEDRLRECVRQLRERRATWQEIGDALDVSRQAAWQRFHGL